MKNYVLGIDFGTLSGRALVVDASNGREVADEEFVYRHAVIEKTLPGHKVRLEPDTALQDPQDWLTVLTKAVPAAIAKAKIKPEQIAGIGIDFTCSTPLPTLADGTPLCFDKSLRSDSHSWPKLWKHHAAQPEADRINEVGRRRNEHFVEVYGGKYSSEWFFAKLLQVVNDSPKIYEAMDRWIEACDWIVWQMTGQERRCLCSAGYKAMWVYPYGDGWAYPSHDFFRELHPYLGNVIDEKLDCDLLPLGASAGKLSPSMAKAMGLPAGIPIASGNVDAHAAVPACSVTTPGKLVMIMGTSTCNLLLGDDYHPVEGMCGTVKDGVVPGYWGYEAGQSAVGDIYGWYVNQAVNPASIGLAADAPAGEVHKQLSKMAGELKVGESGLLALDWWNGNRSVLVDANLSGCLFGLNLNTTPAEIYRALIESTAFGQRRIVDAFVGQGLPVEELYACGGLATKNPVLMQIYADVIGRPIYVADSKQTCALGAAMHAAVAAGLYADIHAAAKAMAKIRKEPFEPHDGNHAAYDKLYGEYTRLHDLLGRHHIPTMKTLKSLRRGE